MTHNYRVTMVTICIRLVLDYKTYFIQLQMLSYRHAFFLEKLNLQLNWY